MIDVTDEMVKAYLDSEDADGPGVEWHSDAVRRHLAAVLAIVERDYDVSAQVSTHNRNYGAPEVHGPNCPARYEPGIPCDPDCGQHKSDSGPEGAVAE
jgi:hypothetical protein